ncbi:6-hydroxynicotinate 3-monooxygenase precursor [Pigmentiphaga humi]|uniref:6-hydroxynicotinate 3-monooxygenase n=1 Tax=Pigmentiphaga humi TaxID=2478468 RepID=A0A3P4B2V4_9BURK|nr:FAD-dependent monooxygenase [Pigmentiphaga humi]VCU70392.1 6-hydroxynicotinate 3-monooxygenase precursor [Pigmentiphaga humi]
MASPLIGISGAGIGGMAAAIALRKLGLESVLFEQAPKFARVGADINLTPNAVLALDGLGMGVGAELRKTAARPTHRISRMWDTGEETSRLEMANAAEERYGAPQLTIHRADLLSALEQAVPASTLHMGKRTVNISEGADGITVAFEDGTSQRVDVLVGADGIHSTVRKYLLGDEYPDFTGVVAYRAVVPAAKLEGVPNLGAFTKWWGPIPETQIVTFPLNLGRDIFIFATIPQDSWRHESWTMPGSVEELRSLYADFHPEARALLDACDEVLKSALYVRDPLPSWSRGNVTLLGDACHPMMPFMAQGAGMAIEDAVVLARQLAALPEQPAEALTRYESARRERTAKIQLGSRGNNWLKDGGNADWVYEYNSWTVPLA